MTTFDKKGGGERVAIALARMFKADLYTGFVDSGKTYDMRGIKLKSFGVSRKLPLIMRNSKISRKFIGIDAGYDVYIFSGTWCMRASKKLKPNILYMHTPPRFLYDLKEYFEGRMNPIQRLLFRKFCGKYRIKDQLMVRQFDSIAVNSENTRKRVMKYYGRDVYEKCSIVNPPVDTKKFTSRKSEGFYLSTSRLDPLKRIDIIIKAFITNGRHLVVASSGPDRERLEKMAYGHDNIKFAGGVSEKKLSELYSRCEATVVAARDEDFGLVAVESMASGKPCIAVNEGGFLEIIEDGKTGVFFEPTTESLNSALEKADAIKWNKNAIMKAAGKYDSKEFERKMKAIAKEVMKNHTEN